MRQYRLLAHGLQAVIQVLETVSHDFRSKRRDRVLRLDVQPGRGGSVLGLEDLCAMLKDTVKASFEARAKAYDDEVRA